ncbi:MAG: CRISPR-associated protein Csm4 [Candidatus Parcubacteria bacterium]|nr:MAG: CRISPR-associated protein Csm4 [Candidatus Parcubacteria bacterium]
MFKAFIIKFISPFHISDKREEYVSSEKFIRSDTLFAAIQAVLQKDISELKEFTISSLFPCYQINESEHLYFFPLPKIPLTKIYSNIENTSIKTIKKVKWIDQILFIKILDGQKIILNKDAIIQKDYLISSEFKEKLNNAELPPYLISEITPRVQIPRYRDKKHTSEPFYFEKVYLNASPNNNPNEGWRMFILVHGNDTDLKKGLEILKNTGIGSDKSFGYGNFDYEMKDLSLAEYNSNNSNNCFINLSLLLPDNPDDIDFKNSFFTLIKRSGYISTFPYYNYRKKPINMIEEGSLISFKKQPGSLHSYGKIVDVTPQQTPTPINHKIYRSGKSILLPINFKF